MSLVQPVIRKSTQIKYSGRSSDFIAPSFGFGCLLNCSYCYLKRHKPIGLDYATNVADILTAINDHAYFTTVDKPNQTHPSFISYDISCNEDFALHAKYYDWKMIFDFFKDHEYAMATLATKIIPHSDLLEYDPKNKIRIRFSLMPQRISCILEPNTALITDRIQAINDFKNAGYDVHINFSPVVIYSGWLDDYKELFEQVNRGVLNKYKKDVLAEVIFLTHNALKHEYNLNKNLPGENLLWVPDKQEGKISSYGGSNIRYNTRYKAESISKFKKLHHSVIPWNTIRYIF